MSVAQLQVTSVRGLPQMCCGISALGFCVNLFSYERVFVTAKGYLFLLGPISLHTWRALYLC